MNGGRHEDMVDERFVLDTLSMLVNVSLRCCDDQVSEVAHKLIFEILSSKAGPLHGQMLRMCSLLCTPSSTEFAKTVIDFMDRAYFSASDGSKSWLVQAEALRPSLCLFPLDSRSLQDIPVVFCSVAGSFEDPQFLTFLGLTVSKLATRLLSTARKRSLIANEKYDSTILTMVRILFSPLAQILSKLRRSSVDECITKQVRLLWYYISVSCSADVRWDDSGTVALAAVCPSLTPQRIVDVFIADAQVGELIHPPPTEIEMRWLRNRLRSFLGKHAIVPRLNTAECLFFAACIELESTRMHAGLVDCASSLLELAMHDLDVSKDCQIIADAISEVIIRQCPEIPTSAQSCIQCTHTLLAALQHRSAIRRSVAAKAVRRLLQLACEVLWSLPCLSAFMSAYCVAVVKASESNLRAREDDIGSEWEAGEEGHQTAVIEGLFSLVANWIDTMFSLAPCTALHLLSSAFLPISLNSALTVGFSQLSCRITSQLAPLVAKRCNIFHDTPGPKFWGQWASPSLSSPARLIHDVAVKNRALEKKSDAVEQLLAGVKLLLSQSPAPELVTSSVGVVVASLISLPSVELLPYVHRLCSLLYACPSIASLEAIVWGISWLFADSFSARHAVALALSQVVSNICRRLSLSSFGPSHPAAVESVVFNPIHRSEALLLLVGCMMEMSCGCEGDADVTLGHVHASLSVLHVCAASSPNLASITSACQSAHLALFHSRALGPFDSNGASLIVHRCLSALIAILLPDFPSSANGTLPRSRLASGSVLDIVYILKQLALFSPQPRNPSGRGSANDDNMSVASKRTSASGGARQFGSSVSRRLSMNSDEDFSIEPSVRLSGNSLPVAERSSRAAMLLLLLAERFVCSSVAWHSPRNMFGAEIPTKIKDMRSAFPSTRDQANDILRAGASIAPIVELLISSLPCVRSFFETSFSVPKCPLRLLSAGPKLLLAIHSAIEAGIIRPGDDRVDALCLLPIQNNDLSHLQTLCATFVKHKPLLLLSFDALKALQRSAPAMFLDLLPAMIQALRFNESQAACADMLLAVSLQSDTCLHCIMWALMSELSSDAALTTFSTFNASAPVLRSPPTLAIDPTAFCGRGLLRVHEVRAHFRSDLRWESRLFLVRDVLLASMSPESRDFLIAEVDFFARLTAVSGRLQPIRKDERLGELSNMLSGLAMPDSTKNLYLPCDPDALVVDMIKDSCAAMQSHAKAPFLLAFKVLKNGVPAKSACIFKMMDDCRQDRLALQMMRVLQDQFVRANTCCLLLPYVVVTTGPSRGVIQCVPRASSRDALGKTWEGSMYTYFITKFGVETSEGYRRVQRNFIRSLAGYSIASFILQMKDRHNGNILVDEDGHLIHIDFGFLFDISPGGNLKFERAPFKMAPEYIQIMGGSVEAPPFKYFIDLCVQGYLAVRRVAPAIIALASLMQVIFDFSKPLDNTLRLILPKDCGLPSYKPMTLSNLKSRFLLDKDDSEAALFMQERVKDAVTHMVRCICVL
jgi:hypothetical protein